ncbi:MAG: hypothetical protein MJB14_14785, partial [Spirochaetes bacterium]|nr:hypothetical protein [Spirochaetota bacterium]
MKKIPIKDHNIFILFIFILFITNCTWQFNSKHDDDLINTLPPYDSEIKKSGFLNKKLVPAIDRLPDYRITIKLDRQCQTYQGKMT